MHTGLLLAVIIAFSAVEVNQKQASSSQPTKTLVELWCGGDDSLTRGVCYAADKAFEASADFAFSDEEAKPQLVVRIPTNVDWKEKNQRTRVFYVVEFTSADDKKFSKRKGTCWDDDFSVCANQILAEARIARRKLLPKSPSR